MHPTTTDPGFAVALLSQDTACVSSEVLHQATSRCLTFDDITDCLAMMAHEERMIFLFDSDLLEREGLAWLRILSDSDLGPVFVLEDEPGQASSNYRDSGAAGVLPCAFLQTDAERIRAFLEGVVGAWEAARAAQVGERETEREASLSQFERLVRDAIHEFRTPLTVVLEFASLLEDGVAGDLDKKQLGYLEHIVRAGGGLVDAFDDFRDVVRFRFGSLAIRPRPTPILDIVAIAFDAVDDDRLALDTAIDPDATVGIIDPDKMGKALGRLLRNGAKCAEPWTRLVVSARRADDEIELSAHYEGRSPSEGDIRLLRDGLVEIEGYEKSLTNVFGLGTLLAARVVELHGGSLELRSERGGGALSFRIPVGEPEPAQPEE